MSTRTWGWTFGVGCAVVALMATSPTFAAAAASHLQAREASGGGGGLDSGAIWFSTPDQAVLKVPFMFAVGSAVLPAGKYTLTPDSEDPTLLWFEGDNGSHAAVVATVFESPAGPGGETRFTFKKYGSDYVLADIAMPGEQVRGIPLSGRELERDLVRMAAIRRHLEHNG